MRTTALSWRLACMALSLALLPFGAAEAHLFHKVFELPDTQLTKDYWVLVRLIEFPNERFDRAAEVYRGENRVRLKPGGFRKWLTRPIEPGMVFKAGYQLRRWNGTLAEEVQRIDRTYGTALHRKIEHGLSTRNAEAVTQAFRQVFFYLISELSGAIWERLENEEAALPLYQFLFRYFSVSLEAFLAINHRLDFLVLRTTVDALGRSLGDPSRDVPPSPEMYQQHRARFLNVLAQALGIPPKA